MLFANFTINIPTRALKFHIFTIPVALLSALIFKITT